MQKKANKVVLDTHVFIWLIQGSKELSLDSRKLIDSFANDHSIYVSAISLWEISMLEKAGRIVLHEPCLQWLKQAIEASGVNIANLTPDIAVESSNLPGDFHSDPADKIIVATARILQAKLITRDAKILKYSQTSHIECIKV